MDIRILRPDLQRGAGEMEDATVTKRKLIISFWIHPPAAEHKRDHDHRDGRHEKPVLSVLIPMVRKTIPSMRTRRKPAFVNSFMIIQIIV